MVTVTEASIRKYLVKNCPSWSPVKIENAVKKQMAEVRKIQNAPKLVQGTVTITYPKSSQGWTNCSAQFSGYDAKGYPVDARFTSSGTGYETSSVVIPGLLNKIARQNLIGKKLPSEYVRGGNGYELPRYYEFISLGRLEYAAKNLGLKSIQEVPQNGRTRKQVYIFKW